MARLGVNQYPEVPGVLEKEIFRKTLANRIVQRQVLQIASLYTHAAYQYRVNFVNALTLWHIEVEWRNQKIKQRNRRSARGEGRTQREPMLRNKETAAR